MQEGSRDLMEEEEVRGNQGRMYVCWGGCWARGSSQWPWIRMKNEPAYEDTTRMAATALKVRASCGLGKVPVHIQAGARRLEWIWMVNHELRKVLRDCLIHGICLLIAQFPPFCTTDFFFGKLPTYYHYGRVLQ